MTHRAKLIQAVFTLWVLTGCLAPPTQQVSNDVVADGVNDDPVALYLGIRLSNNSYTAVKQTSLLTVRAVYAQSPSESIKQDLDEIEAKAGQLNSWQFSYEPHITNMFIGGKLPTDPVDAKLYSNYEEDLQTVVSIPTVAYLPGNLIAGIAFIDLSQILMRNRFPHTTLLNKGMAAKYSNDLIEALAVNEQFNVDYASKFVNAKQVTSYPVTIETKSYTAYVIRLDTPQSFTGYSHKFYTS